MSNRKSRSERPNGAPPGSQGAQERVRGAEKLAVMFEPCFSLHKS